MIAIGETMGLAEWIIDDSCLVFIILMAYQVWEWSYLGQ